MLMEELDGRVFPRLCSVHRRGCFPDPVIIKSEQFIIAHIVGRRPKGLEMIQYFGQGLGISLQRSTAV